MSQSQTSTSLRSTNFHTGGMSSGLAIHEREREEERRRRAKLSRQASNTGEHPLFPEPKKVQPSVEDALQQKIQATLGKFDTFGSSLLQHSSHLLGIQRLPQTPVEGDQKFIFDPKFKDSKHTSELKKAKTALPSFQAPLKTVNKVKEEVKSLKNQKVNGVLNGIGHTTTKSPLVTKTHDANASSKNSTQLKSPTLKETTPSKSAETKKTLSHLKSPVLNETKSTEMKKTEVKPVVNGTFKSRQSDNKEKGSVKEKGAKEGKGHSKRDNTESCKEQTNRSSNSSNKSKPPKIKLSMPERNLPVSSAEENPSVNEPTNVEKIIAEMQQVAPPLTGIHTPIKGGNSIFAFHRNSIQDTTVLPVLPTKRKASENTEAKKDSGNGVVLLNDDLLLTDESDDEHDHQPSSPAKASKATRHRSHSTSSSGSSSEDSDSDSSDSDSDSSASDSNNNTKDKPVKSPVRVPSSSPKPTSGRNWGLDHFVNALNQSSTSPTTKTKPSPSAANTVGEDGVRGNQVAPAANANKSSLNSHVSNHVKTVNEKKSPALVAPEESLTPFAAGLLSHSPEIDHGVDIESLTAKLDLPPETEVTTDPVKPVNSELGHNELPVKIQPPKDNKKGKRRPSTAGTKLNSGQVKSQSENSPKKPLKTKVETSSSKNSASVKLNNSSAEENTNKASKTSKSANGTVGKKSTKKKSETKSSSVTVRGNETVKPHNEVDDEDVIVDIVGVETSPGLDSAKSDSKPTPKAKETEKTKGTKNKPVLTNGHNKHVNGEKLLSTLISPNRTKDILGKNVEITYDEVNTPESLIVRIDLSLLKRIPKLPGNEQTKNSASSPSAETNGSRDMISSSEVKIPKRKLSDVKPVEQETQKKVKSESDVDSNRKKSRERSFSSSSTNSRHSKESHRKRSPSQEEDSYRIKRQRHDSENNKVHDSSLQGLQNGRLNENGVDAVDNGLKPHQCSCNKNNENEKREEDISRFYDPEPRVPYGPDHYLAEAKRLKHKADSSTDKEAKAFLYVDAVLHFARCGKAIEQNEDSESRSAFQMYSETLDLLRYTMRNFVNRYTHRSDRVPDKRLSALCMRIQSILYMRLYKLRKDNVMRNVKMVTEHFRGPPKSTQAPSPYTSNTKITGTPSPLSPTPSPSGSVGSVGSNGSNETMTTPSRNGKPSSGSNAMTSPVNVCIPQKIHAMTQQQVLLVNNLVYSQDLWDQAQPVILEFRDFFMDLDRKCGPLTLHSSIVHLYEYIEEGMKRIQDSLKTEKSS
ncbi:uncharacterized protein LOC144653204 isoform X2 [Oculina patagonica]